MNLNKFAQEVHALAIAKGFYDEQQTDAALIAAIHSEISEAFEEWRTGRAMVYYRCRLDTICNGDCKHDADTCIYKNPKPVGIAVELIDVVLRVLDAAAAWDVTLDYIENVGATLNSRPIKIGIDEYTLPDLIVLLHGIVTDARNAKAYWLDMALQRDMSLAVSAIFAWLRAQNTDPEALMLEKHNYNKTRPYKHGGKRV